MKKVKSILLLSAVCLLTFGMALFLMACSSKAVTLYFDTEGGSEVVAMVLSEKDSLATKTPTKEGHTFAGWYLDEEFRVPLTRKAINFNASYLTVYAKWDKKSFTVSFNSQGGSEVASQTVLYGEKVTETVPTKSECEFDGWFTDADCKTEYGFDSIVVSDLVLYAKWVSGKATVNYVTNGGNDLDSVDYRIGDTIRLPVATRKNYDFAGWYEEENLVTPVGNAGTRVTLENDETTYYAKWIPHTFTIIFESNGGSTVAQQTYDYDDVISLPKNVTKENYDFVAWCTDEECENEFDFTESFSKVTYLYAKYAAKEHTFSFDVMGGDAEISPYTARWDNINLPSPTKTGCTFVGWYCASTDGDGNTDIYAEGFDKEKYATEKGARGDLTLYAKWEANEYTVSFHTFTTAKVDSIIGKYGDVIQKPEDPIDDSSVFVGWYTSVTLQDKYEFIFNEQATIPAEGLELYARWELKTWTIKLNYKKIDGYGNEIESGDTNVSCQSRHRLFDLSEFNEAFQSGAGRQLIDSLGEYDSMYVIDQDNERVADVYTYVGVEFAGDIFLPAGLGDYDYTLTLVCRPSTKTLTINLDEDRNETLVYKLDVDTKVGDFLYSSDVCETIKEKTGETIYLYSYSEGEGQEMSLSRSELNEIKESVTLGAVYHRYELTLHVSNIIYVQHERDDHPGKIDYISETLTLHYEDDPRSIYSHFNNVYYQNYKTYDFLGVFIKDTDTMIIDAKGNLCDDIDFDQLPEEVYADCAYGYEGIVYESLSYGYIVTKIGNFDVNTYSYLDLSKYRGEPIVGIAANADTIKCRKAYTIYAPNVVYIGDCAFKSSYIRKFSQGDKVSRIGAHAFENSHLEEGTFGGKNLVVGTNAFANCDKLKTLTLSHISELGAMPFVDCSALETVFAEKNSSLKKIGTSAFQDCKKLITCDLLLISGLKMVDNFAFKGCTALTTEITVALEEIGVRAFEGCENISVITLTASLKKLGMGAFSSCTGLKTVSLVAVADQAVDAGIFMGSGTDFEIDILDTNNYMKKWNEDWKFSERSISVKYTVRTI